MVVAVLAWLCLAGCTPATVSSHAELYEWMREHGLVDTMVSGGLHLECAVSMNELLAAQDSIDDAQIPFHVILTMTQQHATAGGDVIFNDIESMDEFTARVRDLALRFSEQVVLIQDGLRVECLDATMEYDVGLTRRKRLVLTFPLTMEEAASTDVTIHIADLIIQSTAADFVLRTTSIPSLPTVQL